MARILLSGAITTHPRIDGGRQNEKVSLISALVMKELDSMGCRLDSEGEGEDETERNGRPRVVRHAVTVRRHVDSRTGSFRDEEGRG
jgi:hypothetical protein